MAGIAPSSEVVDAADPTFKQVVNVCRDDPILRELTYNGQPHVCTDELGRAMGDPVPDGELAPLPTS